MSNLLSPLPPPPPPSPSPLLGIKVHFVVVNNLLKCFLKPSKLHLAIWASMDDVTSLAHHKRDETTACYTAHQAHQARDHYGQFPHLVTHRSHHVVFARATEGVHWLTLEVGRCIQVLPGAARGLGFLTLGVMWWYCKVGLHVRRSDLNWLHVFPLNSYCDKQET